VARRRQFAAHLFGGALALLARGALLVQFAQAAPLAGLGAFLRESHLLARPLELRRELGPEFLQLPPARLQFCPARLEPGLGLGVVLALGGAGRLAGLGAQRGEFTGGAASSAACQIVRTVSAAICLSDSGRSGWSMVTRVRPRSSCQNACSTSAGVPMHLTYRCHAIRNGHKPGYVKKPYVEGSALLTASGAKLQTLARATASASCALTIVRCSRPSNDFASSRCSPREPPPWSSALKTHARHASPALPGRPR